MGPAGRAAPAARRGREKLGLVPAHRSGAGDRIEAGRRRGGHAGLRGGLPGWRAQVRRPERSGIGSEQAARRSFLLSAARRPGNRSARVLAPRAGGGVRMIAKHALKRPAFRLTRLQLWLFLLATLVVAGVIAGSVVFARGLVVRNLNDLVPWGLWITIDLSSIALSAGAFLLCAAVYLLGLKQYQPLARPATH